MQDNRWLKFSFPWDDVLWPAGEKDQGRTDWMVRVEELLGKEPPEARARRLEAEVWLQQLEGRPEGNPAVEFAAAPLFLHPLSGEEIRPQTSVPIDRETARKVCLDALSRAIGMPWRTIPKALAQQDSQLGWFWRFMPADAVCPYYTVWQRQAILDAIAQALPQPAFLSFRIGSVQEYIDRSRTTEDYWAASYIVSHLTETAAEVSKEDLGEDAILFPRLPSSTRKSWASYPNGLLAIVPKAEGARLGRKMVAATVKRWRDICGQVLQELRDGLPGNSTDWEPIWQRQTPLERAFEIFWSVSAWDRNSSYAGIYQTASRRLESRKRLRNFEQQEERNIKCHLCGWRESLPVRLSSLSGRRYRFREKEQLCAVCVVRRLAGTVALRDRLPEGEERRFPSTSSIAVTPFLKRLCEARDQVAQPLGEFRTKFGKLREALTLPRLHDEYPEFAVSDWISEIDGRWWFDGSYDATRLKLDYGEGAAQAPAQPAREALARLEAECLKAGVGRPSTYVALLMVDGDSVGEWIRGVKLPEWQASLHPHARAQMAGDGLRRQRPAGILTHLALSECLGNLPTALQEVVERQLLGSVIYTGGDDLLALAPAENLAGALDGIARSVARPTDEERRVLLPGGSFTVSAAALIFPHNDSLSGAIREVTSLLKSQAKEKSGRQSGVIACRRQSGQQTMAWGRWGLVPRARFGTLQELVRAIAHEEEISPRFVQHAFQFAHALSGLDDREGLEAMAVHLFGRSAEEGPLAEQLAKRLRWLISDFYYEWHESGRLLELSPWQRTIDWLVTARFLARQAGPPPPAQAAGTTLEEKKP